MQKFKRAVITGSTSGIGKAMAQKLAKEGIDLLLVGRNIEKLNELENILEKESIIIQTCLCDLQNLIQRQELLAKIKKFLPDLLIQCAGEGYYGEASLDEVEHQLSLVQLNVNAALEIMLTTTRLWLSKGIQGTVLNVSSVAGELVFPCFAVYSASKSFLSKVSCALDYELRNKGIRVLVACPGQVKTDFFKKASQGALSEHPSKVAMDLEKSTSCLWWQLQKQKTFLIFDWKYRWSLRLFGWLLATRVGCRFLKKQLEKRKPTLNKIVKGE
jgi:uncharacterized protein